MGNCCGCCDDEEKDGGIWKRKGAPRTRDGSPYPTDVIRPIELTKMDPRPISPISPMSPLPSPIYPVSQRQRQRGTRPFKPNPIVLQLPNSPGGSNVYMTVPPLSAHGAGPTIAERRRSTRYERSYEERRSRNGRSSSSSPDHGKVISAWKRGDPVPEPDRSPSRGDYYLPFSPDPSRPSSPEPTRAARPSARHAARSSADRASSPSLSRYASCSSNRHVSREMQAELDKIRLEFDALPRTRRRPAY